MNVFYTQKRVYFLQKGQKIHLFCIQNAFGTIFLPCLVHAYNLNKSIFQIKFLKIPKPV